MSSVASAPAATNGSTAPSLSAWGVVRNELLYLSYALQEVALLTPFALVILGWARYWPAGLVLAWLLLLMLLPFNLARVMSLLQLDARRQRRVLFFALLLTMLVSWRLLLYGPRPLLDMSWLGQFGASLAEGGNLLWARDLSIFLLTALVWWRGLRLVGRGHDINRIGLRLRVGGLIIAPLLLWFAGSFLDINAVPFVLLFLLASLTAVALVRAEQIEADQTGGGSTLGARWFAVVFATAAGVTLLGGVLAAFISGDSLLDVLDWLSPLWRAMQFGVTVIGGLLFVVFKPALDLFGVLVQALGQFLAWVFTGMAEGMRQLGVPLGLETPVLPTPTATPGPDAGPGAAGKAIVAFLMLGLMAVVALGLGRLYRQATFAARDSARSERITPEDEGSPGLADRVLGRLGLGRGRRAAASVRRLYAQMCRAAAAAGYPRLETETPYEYLPALGQVWPDGTAESRMLTEAYVRVRYGEIPETREELDALRDAWRRLELMEPHSRVAGAEAQPTLIKRE
jgi:hypothetical protein